MNRGENRTNRVFVNRSLDFRQIAAVGFDLDHTLAVYDDDCVNRAAFEETAGLLVSARGCPPAVATLTYVNSGVIRGICADARTGLMLKTDHRGRVVRARDGRRRLDGGALRALYGGITVETGDPRFDTLDSPFDLPVGVLYPAVLSAMGESNPGGPCCGEVLRLVRETLDETHTRGRLKTRIVANPARYLRNPAAAARAVRRLKATGRRLFLLTNSESDYALRLLEHIFPAASGDPWYDVFDAVFVDADKPAFFENTPRSSYPAGPGARLVRGGSASEVESRVASRGRSVLYVGDNPTDDAAAANRRGWSTAMVVPELLAGAAPVPTDGGVEPGGDSPWGSVFHENGEPTRFARFLSEVPDFYAPGLAEILHHVAGSPD